MKPINERLLRSQSKKQMDKLAKTIRQAGGDIADKVYKSEKSKEGGMPNAYHIDNPFTNSRTIDTYETFVEKDNKKKTPAMNIFNESIDQTIKEGG